MILHRPVEEIVDIIKNHIPKPDHVLAIMLYGSRADGRAHKDSDYDLAIIQNPCSTVHMSFFHDKIGFNCYFYPPRIATPECMTSNPAFFCFRSKPLYDPTGIGAQFTKVADDHVERASRVSPERQEQIVNHLAYLMQEAKDLDAQAKQAAQEDLSDRSDLDTLAEKARIKCLFLSLDYMFLYHGMPDVGAKKELDLLLRDDPALFDLFIRAILPDATFEDAYAWLDAAKKEPFKANSFHIEFDEPSKLPLYTATNRLGQTYIVKQLYLSYKKDLKPEAINPPQHGVRS